VPSRPPSPSRNRARQIGRVEFGRIWFQVAGRWRGKETDRQTDRRTAVSTCCLQRAPTDRPGRASRYLPNYAYALGCPEGGAVFWHGTAGNDAYQPPADPPQTGRLIMIGEVLCLSLFPPFISHPDSPGASTPSFRIQISRLGKTEPEGRQSTSRFVTAVLRLVSTRETTLQECDTAVPKSISITHCNQPLSQSSCCPARSSQPEATREACTNSHFESPWPAPCLLTQVHGPHEDSSSR